MSLFLGIDSGTQSVKAVVLDLDRGRVVAEGRAPHRLIPGLPVGHLEQHPEDWVRAMDRAIRAALAAVERGRIRGIGVSGQQHGFVPLDARGSVIRPAKLWCDTSTTEECELLTRRLGGARSALRATGNRFLPGFTAPKILWLRRHEPANFRRLRHVLLPHDYLNFHLTGRYTMEAGDASGTALLDVRRRRWSDLALAAIDRDLCEWLPLLIEAHQPAGSLRPELARRYGLSPEVLVSAGGGDNMMGAIGTGNVVPGVVSASFGTSGTIYAHADVPVVDPAGEIAGFCSSTGGWLPLLCTMNVTSVTEGVRALLGLDRSTFERVVAAAPAGAGGLLLLPYLAGERTPNVPLGSGVLLGLNRANLDRGRFARAAIEGVTLGMNYGLRRLGELGVRPREIRVTGGGARSAVWRQMMADIFGVPVVGMREDEGAALGAALQAAWCEGHRVGKAHPLRHYTDRVVKVAEATRRMPDRARVRRYAQLQRLQDGLGHAVAGLFGPVRAFQQAD
ncbi:MAG: xylulokinase [Verrucomicrobia bacterium]|nr:xylulokinase [Verrucomicrobiota bacterium]